MALRPYQEIAVRQVYAKLREGKKHVMLQMPTGSGKTHVAKAIIEHGIKHHRRILFIVDRLVLVEQTSESFDDQDIDHGVVQGDNLRFAPWKAIQVCSIQTLQNMTEWPEHDLAIVDEAHVMYTAMKEYMENNPASPVVGLSATPFTTGLGLIYDDLVVATTTSELIEAGWLCGYVAYGPPAPALKGVGGGNDFNQKKLAEAVDTREVVGDVVSHWLELARGLKTIVFAVDIAHAKHLTAEFVMCGIRADYVCGYDDEERRTRVLGEFSNGELEVLINVEVLTKGYDQPDVVCLILARPTKSLMLHIQMMGRGLRTHSSKSNCLILDHGGNIERLGFPDDPLPTELCTKVKGVSSKDRREKEEPKPKACPKCKFLKPAQVHTCPSCGFTPERQADVKHTSTKLERLKKSTIDDKQSIYSQFLHYADQRGYTDGWAAHKYRAFYGVWPRGLSKDRKEPTSVVRGFITSENIRWAKRRTA